MDISQILNIVLGGGVIALLINRWFDRKKDKATADEAGEKARSAALANDALEIQQVLGYTKSLKDFVRETEENTKQIKVLNSRVSELERERDDLKRELQAKETIIEYQKEERHEWTNSLMVVQEKYAESKLKIKTLEERIQSLEIVKENETKLELRDPK